MITVTFWNFAKRKNSTKIPTITGTDFSCDIKTENTITNLAIELNVGSANNPTFTYCYVSDFDRYYFINEWRWDRGLWIAECNVDVLASFKTQISNQSMYVIRCASTYDGHIIDASYPSKTNISYTQTAITRDAGNADNAIIYFNDGVFVVGIADCDGISQGNTLFYQMDTSTFKYFVSKIFTTVDGYQLGDITKAMFNSIVNPLDYITCCRWYPYAFPCNNTKISSIPLGAWGNIDVSGETWSAYALTGVSRSLQFRVDLPKHPKSATRGAYLNSAGYSTYQLIWGSVLFDLNADYLVDIPTIEITIIEDFTSSTGIIDVHGYTGLPSSDPPILAHAGIPIGVDIPLSSNSQSATSAIGAVLGIGATLVGALTGGISTLQGLAMLTAGEVAGVNATKQNIVHSGTLGSGYVTACSPKYLNASFFDVVDENNTEFGRPLMSTRTISTLSGFIKCGHEDVQIDCLESERNEIMTYMADGFFYE